MTFICRFLLLFAISVSVNAKTFDEAFAGATSIASGNEAVFRLSNGRFALKISKEAMLREWRISSGILLGLGEKNIHGATPGPTWRGRWERLPDGSLGFYSRSPGAFGSPSPAASAGSFPGSWILSSPLLSDPAGDGALLVDLGDLLGRDFASLAERLESEYKIPYVFDKKSGSIHFADAASTGGVSFIGDLHFTAAKIPPGASVPKVPDPRSLRLRQIVTLSPVDSTSELPERPPLDLFGFFLSEAVNYSSVPEDDFRKHIKRWRLDHGIEFVIHQSVPEEWRASITRGILSWNAAFQGIGKGHPISVRLARSGEEPLSVPGVVGVYWRKGKDLLGAVGPLQADPDSGEIIGGVIALSDAFIRSGNRELRDSARSLDCGLENEGLADGLGEISGERRSEALGLYMEYVAAHETGHILGLRHNFMGSFTPQPEGGQATNSIMDYLPFKLGASQRPAIPAEPGPYDLLAIEYAYSDSMGPEQIDRIKKSFNDQHLLFGSDIDARDDGVDYRAAMHDSGTDPIEAIETLLEQIRALEVSTRPGHELRQAYFRKMARIGRLVPVLAKGVSGFELSGGSDRFQRTPPAMEAKFRRYISVNLIQPRRLFPPQDVWVKMTTLDEDRTETNAIPPVDAEVAGVQLKFIELLISDAGFKRQAFVDKLNRAAPGTTLAGNLEWIAGAIWARPAAAGPLPLEWARIVAERSVARTQGGDGGGTLQLRQHALKWARKLSTRAGPIAKEAAAILHRAVGANTYRSAY